LVVTKVRIVALIAKVGVVASLVVEIRIIPRPEIRVTTEIIIALVTLNIIELILD
jgi:hypothetical protein